MKFTKEQAILYEKASKTLAFDDLYDLVVSCWPEQIDTSKRINADYERMGAIIDSLNAFMHDDLCDFFEEHEIGNLLLHLDWALHSTAKKAAIILDIVRPGEINRECVKYRFEDQSIGYVIEEDPEKIPKGLRGALEDCYDIELIKEYFQRKIENRHK